MATADGNDKSKTTVNIPLLIGVIIASLIGISFQIFILVLILRWLKTKV